MQGLGVRANKLMKSVRRMREKNNDRCANHDTLESVKYALYLLTH